MGALSGAGGLGGRERGPAILMLSWVGLWLECGLENSL